MGDLIKMAREALRHQHVDPPIQDIQPGDRVVWRRGDSSWHAAIVDFLHTSSDGEHWVFCTLPNGEQNVLNVKFIFDSQKAERRDDETRKT